MQSIHQISVSTPPPPCLGGFLNTGIPILTGPFLHPAQFPSPKLMVVMVVLAYFGIKISRSAFITLTSPQRWIEIMTGAGIVLYMLYLGNYILAAITVAVFAPLIGFHFAVSRVQHSNVEWNPTMRTIKLRS
jgi:hypothetical protein